MVVVSILMAALVSAASVGTPSTAIRGDYVEARSASVFAGACHYSGEEVTTGDEAVMAWKITAGSWNGTDLAGVTAMAAVAADRNLADAGAVKKTELVVDAGASQQQADALAAALEARFSGTLGKIVSVKRAAVHFVHDANGKYTVDAAKFANLAVEPMPDMACCKQPNLVWYKPLVGLKQRRVGFTDIAAYKAGTLGDAWQRSGENSAFYGMFSF